jgi:hypothetical protein
MAETNDTQVKDRRAEEVEELNSPKGPAPESDPEFTEQLIEDVRAAGDLYGTENARDDRFVREQRADNPRPNEDH